MRRSVDEDLGMVLLLRAELIVSCQSEQEERWTRVKRCMDSSIQANRMHDLGDHGAYSVSQFAQSATLRCISSSLQV